MSDFPAYTRARLLGLLGMSEAELALALPGEPERLTQETFTEAELSALRAQLQRYPPRSPCRCQLFLNFKGGTGKTSLSVSYAHHLAELGHRVLLVDLDSQGHASQCVGIETEFAGPTLYEVLIKKKPIEEVRQITDLAELHVLPSNLRMATVDLALMPLAGREYRLKKALRQVTEHYDFVVMDAPPSFGLLNLNAIVAADDLFVPVLPDFLSFHGLKLLFETLDDIEQDLEHGMDRIFILINQFNPTTRIAREAKEALESHYSEFLLPAVVRQCTKFAQASSHGRPIFVFDPESKGAEDIGRVIEQTRLCPEEP